MLKHRKGKILIALLMVLCLFFLAACQGKSNQDEMSRPKLTEKEKGKKDKEAGSGAKPLADVNEIPEDGIITKEQFATVAGEDRDIQFFGETDDGIKYTWTYHASQIQNPEDQNLRITFESEDLDDIKKQANNANDALKMTMSGKGLICPPTLEVEIPEAWQSDTGMLLKEQNKKLAKMSDVTIKSEPSQSTDSSKADGQSEDSSGQPADIASLTEPQDGITTLTMTVLSLDGDSFIVGGITDVDKLAAINQQAQAIAAANANPSGTAPQAASGDDSSGVQDGSGSGSQPDQGSSTNQSGDSAGQSGAGTDQSGASADQSGGSGSGSGSGSSKKGASGDVANNDTGSGSSGSGSGGNSGNGGGSSSASGGSCTISISCSTILNNMDNLTKGKEEFVPSNGWILKPVKVEFSSGESVHDVLKRICRDKGIHMESSYTPAYDSAYVEGINQLYEFDCGELSGWMYSVNGWFPNYGCSKYTISDGDVISWVYTCDLGKDVGDNSMY